MDKEEALQFYKNYKEKCQAYELALKTMFFDMSTIAPVNGNDYCIQMMSLLSGELYDYMINPDHIDKLQQLHHMDLGTIINKDIQLSLKEVNKTALLPKDFYIKMQQTYTKGEVVWRQAKNANNYAMFKDCLKEIVAIKKQSYQYYGVKKTLYDDMLDDYETGMSIEKYDHFFNAIKKRLVPFVKKVMNEGIFIDDTPLHQNFEITKQEKVTELLKDYLHFQKENCYLGTTEHPFTTDFSLHDVRITTKYLENSLISSLFSIIHEYGHALYHLNMDESLAGLKVASSMTCGMHESQSRFLENYIGKRKSFWICLYPQIQKIFPKQLKDLSLDQFVQMINVSQPSLIRTEADELTYPLHILIRYELEKDMINGDVDFDHLDQLWADKYEQYLGIRPADAKSGILQDIHWSGGDFGYFPTYALGSAFAAQFFQEMNKDVDVDDVLAHHHFDVINDWLKEHIHRYGALYNANEMMQKVTHQDFDVNIYIDYLIEKYSCLYHIKESKE